MYIKSFRSCIHTQYIHQGHKSCAANQRTVHSPFIRNLSTVVER